MPITLADVPEEILERILALVLVQSPEFSPRPSWHPYVSPSPTGHRTVVSPLLVCRDWLRIATPIQYRHPVLRSPRHAELLLRALRHTPSLAPCVRSLHLHATSPALRELVVLCTGLHTLDITVDNADAQPGAAGSPVSASVPVAPGAPVQPHAGRDRRVIEFCEAFTRTRSIRHLVIRKNAYLTQPNATYVFEQLAQAIARWHKLESVNVAFRLSPSPAANALTQALAAAPRLHTLHTQLPAVWNTTLLTIAQNAALVRIVLSPTPEHAGAHLFLAEAKRYPRLVDLIRAGTAPPASSPPYPGRAPQQLHSHAAFSLARARAMSSAVAMPPAATAGPGPVPTWGYERDVPQPVCPPSARRGGSGSAGQYLHAHPSGYEHQQRHPDTYLQGDAAQRDGSGAPGRAGPVPVPGTFVGNAHGHAHGHGHAHKRSAGSRRMTAS